MEAARPSVFPKSNDDGVDRVLKSKRSYAYLMESSSIEYQVERHCELMQIGNHLDSKGYGIAMPMRKLQELYNATFISKSTSPPKKRVTISLLFLSDSWYRTLISGAVLKLQESGTLAALKEKWWKKKHGGGKCKV